MKAFDRDLVAEAIAEMGLSITFDNENPGFLNEEGGLLDLLHLAEMADVFQFERGYDEP